MTFFFPIPKSLINVMYATLVTYSHTLFDKQKDKPFSHMYSNINSGDSIKHEN